MFIGGSERNKTRRRHKKKWGAGGRDEKYK